MNIIFKKFAIALAIILAIYAFIPSEAINVLGKFALGWMIMDLITNFFDR